MARKINYLLTAVMLLAESGLVVAGNTGVQFAAGVSVGKLRGSPLTEVSGCAAGRVNDGVFWVNNDSGDSARIHAINRDGTYRGAFNLSGASASDYEDIAIGPGPVSGKSYLYVGDIGDNGAGRSTKQVYRVGEPTIGSSNSGATLSNVEKFTFVYPDGKRDAETLMVDPRNGDVYVVAKRESAAAGNQVYRFKAPLVNGQTYTGEVVARIHIEWLTAGDISSDGSRILIKNGDQSYLWLRNDGESVGAALSRTPIKVPTVNEAQGEAICWDKAGTDYYTISEGGSSSINYFKSLDSTGGGTGGGDTGGGTGGGTGGTDAPTSTNSLQVNKQLTANQYVASSNGKYRFYLQGDGNLVLRNTQTSQAVWASATNGKGGTRLVMQGDGNLVLYTSANKAVWATATNGKGAAYLMLRNDGNLVLANSAGAVVWQTNTSDGSGAGTGGGDTGGGTGGNTTVLGKIAFVGDTGYGANFQNVLNLIKAERAELTILVGDTSYSSSGDSTWDSKVRSTLGASDPVLLSLGNHDVDDSNTGNVLNLAKARLANQSAVKCTGNYGHQMTCNYKGIYFVMPAVGTTGSVSANASYIADSLNSVPAGAWRVCAWHKNQHDMQVGDKADEVGWDAYENCRKKGAIIATGHEHSYSRTHLLSSMNNKTVASTASDFTVTEGKTFAFVSGLGGVGIRDQNTGGNWWAKIYTSTQGATYGAMFATFYADRADFYFKNINGQIIDQFTVRKGY